MLARILAALLLVAACMKESPTPAGSGPAPAPGTATPGTGPDPSAGAPAPPATGTPAPPATGPTTPPATGTPTPPAPKPTSPPAPKPTSPGAGPKLGEPCGAGDACGEGTCVTYYGIAGPRGPAFKSCEVRCDAQRRCAGGRKCITVADGPGEVCR